MPPRVCYGPWPINAFPLNEYLRDADYRPDREYVDGVILERDIYDVPHSAWQMALGRALSKFRTSAEVRVFPSLRLQVTRTRYRVPDITVIRRDAPDEQVIAHAPLLCVEIGTREEMSERVADYARMGIGTVWVIDPVNRIGYQCSGMLGKRSRR
jgi:Uma2 family endonuclease